MTEKLRHPGIFGQLCWDTYTVIVLGFADQPGTGREEVLDTLDKAAFRLLEAYPFLAGQVVKHGQSATNSGKYEIVPYEPHQNRSPVHRKDCTKLCPAYASIVKADAPFAMLDGDVICPRKGIGHQYEIGTELPVLIIQANFIEGGLILSFASMHNALDMNGQGVIMKMFAAAGRGDVLDARLIAIGNQDADTVVPLLEPGETAANHDSMRRPSTLQVSGGQDDGPQRPVVWVYWCFSGDDLVALKKEATNGPRWVSTNDAVTAFLIQRLTTTRVVQGRVAKDERVKLQRAVDSRAALDPPVEYGYLGHLVSLADSTWETASELAEASLADVAVEIRDSLNRVDDHHIRSLATLINSTDDKTTIFYGAQNKTGRDFLVSSWAQLEWLYGCDFGKGLGVPDFVRRARMDLVPDLTYLMPKDRQGNMHLATCLFHEDFVGLANDEAWTRRASLVG